MNLTTHYSDFALTTDNSYKLKQFLLTFPLVSSPLKVRQCLIFKKTGEKKFDNIVETICRRNGIKIINRNIATDSYECLRLYGNEKKVKGTFTFIPTEKTNFYYLTSICNSDFWIFCVRHFLKHSYPYFKSVFHHQDDIINSLNFVKEKYSLNSFFKIKEVTTKEKRKYSKQLDTERRWTNLDIDPLLEQVKERTQFILSINISHYQKQNEKFGKLNNEIKLFKTGEIFTDNLNDQPFHELKELLESKAIKRLEFFKNRGLREREYKPAAAIEIKYKTPIFLDKEEFDRLRIILKKYPNSNKSIYHSNPYFYISILDNLDGSSYDVIISEPDRIKIIPQAKSSQQGFEKLISHLFLNFKEGDIEED